MFVSPVFYNKQIVKIGHGPWRRVLQSWLLQAEMEDPLSEGVEHEPVMQVPKGLEIWTALSSLYALIIRIQCICNEKESSLPIIM